MILIALVFAFVAFVVSPVSRAGEHFFSMSAEGGRHVAYLCGVPSGWSGTVGLLAVSVVMVAVVAWVGSGHESGRLAGAALVAAALVAVSRYGWSGAVGAVVLCLTGVLVMLDLRLGRVGVGIVAGIAAGSAARTAVAAVHHSNWSRGLAWTHLGGGRLVGGLWTMGVVVWGIGLALALLGACTLRTQLSRRADEKAADGDGRPHSAGNGDRESR